LAKLVHGAEPAVIVVDLAMPGIGGAAFIRKMRASAFAHVPLLLLSGWGHVDRFHLDVDRVISKPFEPASLARAVDRLASTRSHSRARQTGASAPAVGYEGGKGRAGPHRAADRTTGLSAEVAEPPRRSGSSARTRP
jgi:DNA-binding response OmpR family regulator